MRTHITYDLDNDSLVYVVADVDCLLRFYTPAYTRTQKYGHRGLVQAFLIGSYDG